MTSRVLYLFGSAAPPVHDFPAVVEAAQGRGFTVCVGLTPTAAEWLSPQLAEVEQRTGHPVRSRYKKPGAADAWPTADVIAFAPVTANSLNSWALCLTHNFAVGVVAEGIGKEIPMVAMPCVNAAYAAHPQVPRSIETLRGAGVRVLYGDGGFVPNAPGQGRPAEYPWTLVLDAAEQASRPGYESAPGNR
ncbi:flavoprotein [Streptomyces zingiberis]|uniref:Flavoprotein n=1 Tax=Streptomyces zingiberis TaxID=2053010 RepID=A0ABX1BRZ5_9ACTN|nr:flavoprotein [Streptomyces zingiberis]NJQ00501.1 flavoprotein [Streptomyces zingiberis]